MRWQRGDAAPRFVAVDAAGREAGPAPGNGTLVAFLRDPACPASRLHLQTLVQAREALGDHGVAVLVVFPVEARRLVEELGPTGVPVVPDPSCRLFARFGVERRPLARLN